MDANFIPGKSEQKLKVAIIDSDRGYKDDVNFTIEATARASLDDSVDEDDDRRNDENNNNRKQDAQEDFVMFGTKFITLKPTTGVYLDTIKPYKKWYEKTDMRPLIEIEG